MASYWEICKSVWDYCNYSTSLRYSLDTLKTEFLVLSIQESGVEHELQAEVLHGRKRKREVDAWLQQVKRTKRRVNDIEKNSRKYFVSRRAFRNHVTNIIDEVVRLQEKGIFQGELFADLLHERGNFKPVTKLVGMTATRIFNNILMSLVDPEVKIIGVYGIEGGGKTTILTHIYNRIRGCTTFWVSASGDSDIERLQNSIAEAIGLKFPNEVDNFMRSTILFEALKRMKNSVIILDDLPIHFSLEDVGIPDDKECKIVLTTQSKGVCRRLNCSRKFEVPVLPKEESWELFKEHHGTSVELSSEVEQIKKDVNENCDGLAQGIISVAKEMREKDNFREWRNLQEEFKRSEPGIEDMEKVVFPKLKRSYDRIKSERIQYCFLCCALYPKHYVFSDEELIKHWRAEGLIDDMRSPEKELDKGYSMLSELTEACMLARKSDNSVTMQALNRDLAIRLTRESPRFVVKAGIGITGSIDEEEFTGEVEKISLMRNGIEMISGEPNCPKICTLMLRDNPLSDNISHGFFNRMNGLKLLDLSFTGIEYVPSSVSNLENLCELWLNGCGRLRTVPSLEKLKRLKVLNLSDTCIKKLPPGMKRLVSLKELYVRSTEWVDYDFNRIRRYVQSGHWKYLKTYSLCSRSTQMHSPVAGGS